MLARLFVLVGSLIVAALVAALIGPYFVDWTSYRADFEREAAAILGRKVEVRGDAEARILPFPSLSFKDVVVGGGAGEPVLTAASFSMDAELAPFLRGEVLIFDMRLDRPNATLTIGEDGVVDWAIRPSSPFEAGNISLEKLTIADGKVRIIDRYGGREHLVSEINSTLSARSLAGPWRFDGSLKVDGKQSVIAASSGVADGSGATRLRITAHPEAFPIEVEADGNVSLPDGVPSYAGTFRVAGLAPAKAGGENDNPGVVAAPPNRLVGKFSLGKERLDIEPFRFETGPVADPYVAEGTAFVELGKEPSFYVTANGAQVRLTNWGENVNEGATVGDRLSALQEALALFIKPPIPGRIDVSLPAVVAGDTTIRDVGISASPALEGWYLSSASATLPGRSTLEAKGFLTTGKKPRFEGSLLLAVKQPSGFAAWLSKDVNAAVRRLPAAGFSADVFLDDTRQSFQKLELILGEAKLTGAIERQTPRDAKPVITGALTGGEMTAETGAAFASLFVSDAGALRFLGHDLDLKLKAGPVSAAGLTAASLDAALRVKDDRLDIDRLALSDLAGASLSATGSIRQLTGEQLGDIDATVTSGDLEPLIDLLARTFPADKALRMLDERVRGYAGLLKDTRIDIIASAAATGTETADFAVSAKGNAGGGPFSATVSGASRFGAMVPDAPLELTFEAHNDDAAPLLAISGMPTLPITVVGQGKLSVNLKGTLAQGLQGSAALTGDGFLSSYDGVVRPTEDGIAARGKVHIEAQDIEPWLMTVGATLPGMGFGTPAALSADADYAKGLLVLEGISGTVAGSALTGDLNVAVESGAPKFTGALSVDTLDLTPLAALVLGEPALDARGDGGWPTTPFAEKASAPFSADVTLSAGSLQAGGLPPLTETNLALQIDGERLRAADVTGKFAGGSLGGLFELKNDGGVGLLSSQLKLGGADLALLLPALGIADPALSGHGDVTVNATSSAKSLEGLVAALSGSGTVSLHGLQVAGLNSAALPDLVARSDAIGRGIDAAKTAEFAPRVVRNGTFDAGNAEFAFNIASGAARIAATSFDREKAKLTVEIRADLAAQLLSGDGVFAFKPGDDALVGAEPEVRLAFSGPLTQPQVTLDTGPLSQFLTQRQLEIEQARVEAMQAALLEKQRLRRETAYYVSLQKTRRLLADEDARRREAGMRLFQQQQARLKAEQEAARLKAEEEARLKAEEAARLKAEQAVQLKADEAARLKADEAARVKVEEAARVKAEEAARVKAEEAAPVKAEEDARVKAKEAARVKAEEAARVKTEEAQPPVVPSPETSGSIAAGEPGASPAGELAAPAASVATPTIDAAEQSRREALGQIVREQQRAAPPPAAAAPSPPPAAAAPPPSPSRAKQEPKFPPPPPKPTTTFGDFLKSLGP